MPWFKVDDGLPDHPKVLLAGNAAMGLWVRAGAWSMKHLTDGFIPEAFVRLLGTAKEARALVTAGLWVKVEGGSGSTSGRAVNRRRRRCNVTVTRRRNDRSVRANVRVSHAVTTL